jgi:hypothetical protein
VILRESLVAARASLERTPELLPELKKAGIVSLSSMETAASFSATIILSAMLGVPTSGWLLDFAIFATPFMVSTHRTNIGCLVHGEEKRFEKVALLRTLWRTIFKRRGQSVD